MTVEVVDAFVRADACVGGVGECESCDSVRGARAPVEEEAGRAWPVSIRLTRQGKHVSKREPTTTTIILHRLAQGKG